MGGEEYLMDLSAYEFAVPRNKSFGWLLYFKIRCLHVWPSWRTAPSSFGQILETSWVQDALATLLVETTHQTISQTAQCNPILKEHLSHTSSCWTLVTPALLDATLNICFAVFKHTKPSRTVALGSGTMAYHSHFWRAHNQQPSVHPHCFHLGSAVKCQPWAVLGPKRMPSAQRWPRRSARNESVRGRSSREGPRVTWTQLQMMLSRC